MSEEKTITILGEKIPVHNEKMSIDDLRYFEENPRVYSSINVANKPEDAEELQKFIHTEMLKQPSAKNLISDIKKNEGLLEPILIRYDTRQVIEGNSRLAVFRYLYGKENDEKWATMDCECVSSLTQEQQDTYLNQIHIKGKTSWSAYEKANFAYTREKEGVSISSLKKRFSTNEEEINKRIRIIQSMKNNNDNEKSHFSYYDVLVRSRTIYNSDNYDDKVRNFLLSKIKKMGKEDSGDIDFTAHDLRKKMPHVLKNKKELGKFIQEKTTLDEAYQNTKSSSPLKKVKAAKERITDITKGEVFRLKISDINALLTNTNQLVREVKRVQSMVEKVKEEKDNNV